MVPASDVIVVTRVIGVCTIGEAGRSAKSRHQQSRLPAAEPSGVPSFWHDRRGRLIALVSYPLLTCPELSRTTYVLSKRSENGEPVALAVGRVEHWARSLNLATLRHHAAGIGADEIHVIAHSVNARQRRSYAGKWVMTR